MTALRYLIYLTYTHLIKSFMYTRTDANNELISRMDNCMNTRDVEEAYKLCDLLAELGDDENAHAFRMMAVRWEREDNYHDEVSGN